MNLILTNQNGILCTINQQQTKTQNTNLSTKLLAYSF